MKFLLCGLCRGELEIIGSAEMGVVKLTRCLQCSAQFNYPNKKPKEVTTYVKRYPKTLHIDPAIDDLLKWRNSATDRYGDDLECLLIAEFSSAPEVSHHNRQDVPVEHQAGLKAFRSLSYDNQYKVVKHFVNKQ